MAKQKTSPLASTSMPTDPILEARTRARRRLLGAAVLLGVGLIAFPLIFQTQPRSVAHDIPIIIPDPTQSAPLSTKNEITHSTTTSNPIHTDIDHPSPGTRVDTSSRQPITPAKDEPDAKTSEAFVLASANSQIEINSEKESSFVVQVGSYKDIKSVRELRHKIESLGLKTYIQDVEIKGDKWTRIRLGPYSNRSDAISAQKKLKSLGVSPVILSI